MLIWLLIRVKQNKASETVRWSPSETVRWSPSETVRWSPSETVRWSPSPTGGYFSFLPYKP